MLSMSLRLPAERLRGENVAIYAFRWTGSAWARLPTPAAIEGGGEGRSETLVALTDSFSAYVILVGRRVSVTPAKG
jgi:hypothetical protein